MVVVVLITCLNLHTCTQHWDNTGYEPISGGTKQPQIEYCVDGMMRNCSRWLRRLSIMHMNVGLSTTKSLYGIQFNSRGLHLISVFGFVNTQGQ